MALAEVEFELTGEQYERMDYPGLKQGHWLPVILDAGILMPDFSSPSWFTVQQEPSAAGVSADRACCVCLHRADCRGGHCR